MSASFWRFHKLLADNSTSLAHVCRLLADGSQFLAHSSYSLADTCNLPTKKAFAKQIGKGFSSL
jgi:hypothetical protein